MIGLAALSGPLPKAGIVVAAAVVAVALLHPDAVPDPGLPVAELQ